MRYLSIILLTFLMVSCKKGINTFDKYIGESFIISDRMTLVPGDEDVSIMEKSASYKIIVYFDSLSCTPCLFSSSYQWDGLINFTEYHSDRVSTLLLFTPRKSEQHSLKEYIESENPFNYPVLFDNEGDTKKNNPWLPDGTFVCLIDSCDRVVLAGNPMIPNVWEDYKKIIKTIKK